MKIAWILISVVAGILTGALYESLYAAAGVIVFAIAVRLALAVAVRRDIGRIKFYSMLHYMWVLMLFFGMGMLSVAVNAPDAPEIADGSECEVQALVESRVTSTRGERYNIDVLRINGGKCRNVKAILFADAMDVLHPGEEIAFHATIKNARRRNPGDALYVAFPERDVRIRIVGERKSVSAVCHRLRESLICEIERLPVSPGASSLLKALLTASRDGMGEERLQHFRDAGVAHALALSGMHVGIIATFMLMLTLPMVLIPGGRKARYIIAIAGIWAFTLLTGGAYSTMRAALMFTIAGIAWILERRRSVFSAICAAAMLILIFSPYALWNVGFQLSVSCVMALALFAERLNPVNHREHPVTHKICSALLVTIIATGVTWVVTGKYFGTVPLNFLFCNIVILPILPFFMGFGMLALAAMGIGMELQPVHYLLDVMADFLYRIVSLPLNRSLNIEIGTLSVVLWIAATVCLAVSLNIKTVPASGFTQASDPTVTSRPWLYAALLLFAATVITLIIE